MLVMLAILPMRSGLENTVAFMTNVILLLFSEGTTGRSHFVRGTGGDGGGLFELERNEPSIP